MFSHRLPFHLALNPIAHAIARRRAAGLPILDLTESNPTRAGIEYPSASILAGFAEPQSLVYDPSSNGLPHARAQVASLYGVDSHRVVLTASSSEAYSWLFKLLCDPGDQILAPRPSYPLFEHLAGLESVRVRQYPLRYDHGWFIDFEPLIASINEQTRAIVVVSPNNPTGSYIKAWELDQLMRLCASYHLTLISDEVFFDYPLDAANSCSLTCVKDVLTFCLGGLSKMVGMPQMKLGWMIAGGPDALREEALSRIDLIADNFLSVGTPVQYALPKLLAARTVVQQQIIRRLRANLELLKQAVASESAFRCLEVEGGWYAILRVPQIRTEEEWTLLLLDRGVLVQPGFYYDFESEAYLVVSLLTPEDTFREGVERIVINE